MAATYFSLDNSSDSVDDEEKPSKKLFVTKVNFVSAYLTEVSRLIMLKLLKINLYFSLWYLQIIPIGQA